MSYEDADAVRCILGEGLTGGSLAMVLSLMTSDRAAEALSDLGNWWRYDPADDSDPDATGHPVGQAADNRETMKTLYSIVTTAGARDQGTAIWLGNG